MDRRGQGPRYLRVPEHINLALVECSGIYTKVHAYDRIFRLPYQRHLIRLVVQPSLSDIFDDFGVFHT